jgi:hypothetical protein
MLTATIVLGFPRSKLKVKNKKSADAIAVPGGTRVNFQDI